jgi:hypothetical protein
MNIMEETKGTYRIEVSGLSIREIKDIFEDKYGALMWNGGGAYPCDGVTLQFKRTDGPAALPVGELTDDTKRLDALEASNVGQNMWIVARGKDSFTVALKSPYGNCLTRHTLREAIDAAIEAAHHITQGGKV